MKKIIAIMAAIFITGNFLYSSAPSLFSAIADDSLACSKDIKVSFISTSKKTYDKNNDEIEIVFDGVFVDYAFEQLGYVEVSATDSIEIGDLIECLKSTASAKGADAVINIKRHNTKNKTTFSGILIKHVEDESSDEHSSVVDPEIWVVDKKLSAPEKFLSVLSVAFVISLYVISEIHY